MLEIRLDRHGRAYVVPARLTRWRRWCAAFHEGRGPLFWGAVAVATLAMYAFLFATLWLGITLEM